MNQEQLMQALGGVDEEMIAEATSYQRTAPRRNKRVIALLIVLGVLALSVGAGVAIRFSGVTLSRATVDHDDPEWADLLEDAPYANEMQYAEWAAQHNRMTAEIKAQLEEMEGKEEMSHRYFASVSELEDAYGIKLLKLGEDECNVQATLCFLKEEDHAAGSHLIGWWNAYEDGAYLHTSVSCIYGNPEMQMSMGIPMTEAGEEIEYEIQSLGVTAKLVTAKIQGEREIDVFFSYDGVDYYFAVFQGLLSTNRNVTIEWVCDKLETLHE